MSIQRKAFFSDFGTVWRCDICGKPRSRAGCRERFYEWVRRRALHRATGMHPQHGGVVINALVCEGLIEEVDFCFGSSHPAIEGYLGQTHNYRIAQEGKSHE